MKQVLPVLLPLVLLFFSACSSSHVNRANFEKVKTGMSQAAVIELLGEPDDMQTMSFGGFSGTAATWTGSNGTISIQFLNGEVQAKQFSKAER